MSENGATLDHPPATLSVQEALRVYTAMFQRLSLRQGVTFQGRRDLYDTLGYQRELTYQDYYARYRRGGIAKRLIDAPIDATWRQDPILREKDKPEGVEDSAIETAFQDLAHRLELWNHIIRVDRLASIGQYAVLVLGTRHDANLAGLATELPRAAKPEDLVALQAFSQEHAEIASLVSDITSPQFGKPAAYAIDFSRKQAGQLLDGTLRGTLGFAYTQPVIVHASRIIHVPAEGPLEDDIYGLSALEVIWNYLDNLDKVLGGSAEMFWQDAKRRLVLNLKEGAVLDDPAALTAEVEEFVHELRNFLRVQGMEVTQLNGTIPDPRSNFEANIEAICATKKIPKRILLGTERGELASDQDEQNWLAGTILTRQMRHAEPLLRRFIDRLTTYNYLPRVPRGYEIEWPPARVPTEEQRANIALTRSRAIATYAGTMRSPSAVLPLEYYLTSVLEWDPDQVQDILDTIEMEQLEEQEAAEERAAAQGLPEDVEQNPLTPERE